MEEFNRVLGGGVVPGSLVLIGGDPGIGKSTLLCKFPTQLANKGTVFMFLVKNQRSRSSCVGSVSVILTMSFISMLKLICKVFVLRLKKIQPDFLIIDSIQTVMSPEISSVQGSVSQVREVTAELMQLAKTNNIATFIVGHVTKEGTLAGPRMLEHMVDTVLYFEGERQHTFRILRAVKNRFGSTNEIGILK